MGKYLSQNIQEPVAHKANLRKPLFFWKCWEATAAYARGLQLCRGKTARQENPTKKGIVSPH